MLIVTIYVLSKWLSPVRTVGMAAYLLASISCWCAWSVLKRKSARRLTAILGATYALLLLDIAFDWRWKLYDFLKSRAIVHGIYEQRRGPQVAIILLLGMVVLAAIAFSFRRLRTVPGASLAVTGVLLSVAICCMELISLHAIDSFFYHQVGSLTRIAFAWLLAAGCTIAGALRMIFSVRRKPA